MNKGSLRGGVALGLLLLNVAVRAEAPPISAFARGEEIVDAAISPDGRYLAVLTTLQGLRVAVVQDRSVKDGRAVPVMSSAADNRFYIDWCHWATNTRLLCGLRGGVHDQGIVYIATRLAAVDADGKHLMTLVQGNDVAAAAGQLQDEIIDWSPGPPDTVLIAAQASRLSATDRAILKQGAGFVGNVTDEFPSLYELNVVTGKMQRRMEGRRPLREYLSDHQGQVRLGWGVVDGTDQIEFDARDPRSGTWQRLLKYEAFHEDKVLRPIAICADKPDCAYAIGDSEGRAALWRMDLTGRSAPVLEFSHPAVDVDEPLFANDGRLLGVMYATDRPFVYYTDAQRAQILRGLKSVLPGKFIVITDATRDDKLYLVRTSSDVDGGTYYLLDVVKGELSRIGTAYPELEATPLGRMQTISYAARDGTVIPGYLTVPPGVRAEHLPLVVMPHGGPISRDTWRFDFLRAFLVSRGYAVLQMNFRGSAGYGSKWFYDAHQDWGGLTYSDIADGARWAVREGIADPARVGIVGWSFGGYAALLGAVRNGDLFRCAVSIAGVSDLTLLEREQWQFVEGAIARRQIGTDSAKLKADSPRNHAAEIAIPLLMIHGDNDAQANIEQSKAMDRALSKYGKPHELILIDGADHQMSRASDRTTLLTAVEKFLALHLGVGTVASSGP